MDQSSQRPRQPATVLEAWAACKRCDYVVPFPTEPQPLPEAGLIWVVGDRARPLLLAIETCLGAPDVAFDCLAIERAGGFVVVQMRPRDGASAGFQAQLAELNDHPDTGLAWRL